MVTAIEAGVNAVGYSGRLFETVARVSDDRCENLWATCHRSRVRYDRFPDVARSSCVACARSRAFSPMSDMTVAGIDDSGVIRCPPGSPIPATGMSILFIGAWRTIAVVVFSLCALVQNVITISFVRRARRLHARAVWLHHWSRFACRVLGFRVTTRGLKPSSGLLVSNHLSYLDIVVLSSIQPCVFVAKRDVGDVAALWLAGARRGYNLCRSRAKILHPQSGGCRSKSDGYRLSGCSFSRRNKLGWLNGVAI